MSNELDPWEQQDIAVSNEGTLPTILKLLNYPSDIKNAAIHDLMSKEAGANNPAWMTKENQAIRKVLEKQPEKQSALPEALKMRGKSAEELFGVDPASAMAFDIATDPTSLALKAASATGKALIKHAYKPLAEAVKNKVLLNTLNPAEKMAEEGKAFWTTKGVRDYIAEKAASLRSAQEDAITQASQAYNKGKLKQIIDKHPTFGKLSEEEKQIFMDVLSKDKSLVPPKFTFKKESKALEKVLAPAEKGNQIPGDALATFYNEIAGMRRAAPQDLAGNLKQFNKIREVINKSGLRNTEAGEQLLENLRARMASELDAVYGKGFGNMYRDAARKEAVWIDAAKGIPEVSASLQDAKNIASGNILPTIGKFITPVEAKAGQALKKIGDSKYVELARMLKAGYPHLKLAKDFEEDKQLNSTNKVEKDPWEE